jgi:Mn2+/Fe2+ NRAMP family transporter
MQNTKPMERASQWKDALITMAGSIALCWWVLCSSCKLQLGELLCLVQMNMVVFPVGTCTCISPPCSDKKTDVNWSFSMFVFVVVSPCKILSIVEEHPKYHRF